MEQALKDSFAYWRSPNPVYPRTDSRLNPMSAARAFNHAKRDVAEGKRRYGRDSKAINYGPLPENNGARRPWRAWNAGCRWIENPVSGLRLAGYADDICRSIQHTGWHLDPWGDGDTARGIVYQLPGRDGAAQYVPGVECSYEKSGRGAYLDFSDIHSDKLDAARAADWLAERYAEDEREYLSAWQAGALYADKRQRIADLRRERRALVAEMRHACRLPGAASLPVLRRAIAAELATLRERSAEAWRQCEQLKNGGAEFAELWFSTSEERLTAAFNEGAGETIL